MRPGAEAAARFRMRSLFPVLRRTVRQLLLRPKLRRPR